MIAQRALWLDDEPDFVASARHLIDDLVHELRLCTNADEGLDEFNRWEPDLVLLDLRMPPGNWGGITFLERLGKRVTSVPIVALSGAGSITQCLRAIQLGAVDYIEKEQVLLMLRSGVASGVERFYERQPLDDYGRVRKLETAIHEIVIEALKAEAQRRGEPDIFIRLVPARIALKSYQRRLEEGGGAQEQYLDLIDLREIIDKAAKLPAFEALDIALKPRNRDERTKWIVDLNNIRRVVAHPIRTDLNSSQRRRLEEVEDIVRRWATGIARA